ncbi:1-aminocyclopropane-1-carboxylate synthase-like protein 1 [Glandiceps talaboti]
MDKLVLSDKDSGTDDSLLSQRGDNYLKTSVILEHGASAWQQNKYHKEKNPQGIINLGTAENIISHDLVAEKLSQLDNPFKVSSNELLRYQPYTGMPELKTSMTSFLNKHSNVYQPLDPANLVILNGCGPCIAALAQVLCNAKDAWLISTPYYASVQKDVQRLADVQLVHADLTSQSADGNGEPFQLTVSVLEEALLRAQKQDINVRVLFLMNPHNPLGDVYSEQLLKDCLQFAKRHKLHVILDEIYMFSVFQDDTKFVSVLSLDNLPDPQRTHFIWGFSKDFCMSGLRCGAIYSWNKQVISALGKIAFFFCASSPTQVTLNQLLADEEWMTNFMLTNCQRLKESHKFMSQELTKLGIPHLVRPAAIFIWIDLRQYISPLTFENELLLYQEFLDCGVYIPAGKGFFCSEPGWFRMVFTIPRDWQDKALKRIAAVLMKRK